ncbi:MAG: histidine kinase [Lachnospiraceae bacterium]|nr:histidine kinase [Lachnospiraceae bacterium]
MIVTMMFAVSFALAASAETYLVSYRYLRRAQKQSLRNNLQVLAGEIDTDLDHTMTFLNWLSFDSSVNNYLMLASRDDLPFSSYKSQAVATYDRMLDEFYSCELRGIVERAVIAPADGNTFIQILTTTGNSRFETDTLMASDYFQKLMRGDDTWIGIVESRVMGKSAEKVIPIVRTITSNSSSKILGWVYLELSPEVVSKQFSHYTLADGETLYVTIGDGCSYVWKDGVFQEAKIPDNVISCSLQENGWSIHLATQTWMVPPAGELVHIVVLLFVFMVLFGLLLSVLLQYRITRPVNRLLVSIGRTANGDFSRDPAIEWDDELGAIGKGINDLSENVDRMMKKQVQDERTKQELNYEILQSQINPHFMYNTLNTIKWMAVIQGADGIADVSTALSRLLKNVAKGKGSLIPLSEEIHLVDDYFTIMKYRYCGTIELEYEIADRELLSCMVNRFSLQPIVENAIFHGIEPNGGAGKIRIHIYPGKSRVETPLAGHPVPDWFMDVTDNGVGMSQEAIQKTLSGQSTDDTDFFRHVGVSNVQQRIRFHFGETFGITIDSVQRKYTTMRFHLPQVREGERTDVQNSDCG